MSPIPRELQEFDRLKIRRMPYIQFFLPFELVALALSIVRL